MASKFVNSKGGKPSRDGDNAVKPWIPKFSMKPAGRGHDAQLLISVSRWKPNSASFRRRGPKVWVQPMATFCPRKYSLSPKPGNVLYAPELVGVTILAWPRMYRPNTWSFSLMA